MKECFYVEPVGFNGCIFQTLETALREVKEIFKDGDNVSIIITKKHLTQEQFDNLPEFQGY